MLGLVACGGGGAEGADGDGELLQVDFGNLPAPPTPATIQEVFKVISDKQGQLVETSYLFYLEELIREVRQVGRDLERLGEMDDGMRNLDWVREVHEISAISELLQDRAYSLLPPEGMADDYRNTNLVFWEGTQLLGFGTSHMLDAAILLGPSGRRMQDLPGPTMTQLKVLVKQSRFFLVDADVLLSQALEDVTGYVQRIRIQ